MKRIDNRFVCLLIIDTQIFITRLGGFPVTDGYHTIIFGEVDWERNIIVLLLIVLVTKWVAGITIGIKGMVKRSNSIIKEA
ncbi:hypothetical protein ICM_06127 [Bacillus cereus BAG1X2-3]|uniref:Uncharacterized protein n=1 Tax=Bacillus cereus TaxID=1396 RepID=A0A9X7E324_BACCE|nr:MULTISPECIES: hypothetical protein [Bacillus cereus group]EOO23194.1 hypothetical protein ICC_06245 [Bacillus cereus BAG1X1-1]EOO46982.1 hypothetical protein ICK_05254 [Bacillus cereus BAG1X2-2]EOO55028.1 hypothetical protein ICI_00105 [Bacillus cereus BAG1X2-1]EOO63659.1 hypothetical protein ICM_06127 [Bacillus cereus BAG1X2-3]EOP11484.1 hypothetical protein ICO_00105 [Bacillus cereus BAG2O-1]